MAPIRVQVDAAGRSASPCSRFDCSDKGCGNGRAALECSAFLHEDIARKRQPLFQMLVELASIRLSLCAVLLSERFQASSLTSEGSGSAKHADQSADPVPVGDSARTVEATSSAAWFAARTSEPMQRARRTRPHPIQMTTSCNMQY